MTTGHHLSIDQLRHLADQIKLAAMGRWTEILLAFGFTGEELSGREGPCRKCSEGRAESTRFRYVDPSAGACRCSHCFRTECGDGIAAIQWLNNWTFIETIKKLCDYLHIHVDDCQQTYRHNGQQSHSHVPPSQPAAATSRPITVLPSPEKLAEFRKNLAKQFSQFNQSGVPEGHWLVSQCHSLFAKQKPPIEPLSMERLGVLTGKYPGPNGEAVIAVSGFLSGNESPVGMSVRLADGRLFPPFKNSDPAKAKQVTGTTDSWVLSHPVAEILSASEIWRVEGLPDQLTLNTINDSCICLSSLCGATSTPRDLGIFTNKTVVIIGHSDWAGIEGARKFAGKLPGVAKSIKIVFLPFEGAIGKDLRDWANLRKQIFAKTLGKQSGELTGEEVDQWKKECFAELQSLAEATPEFDQANDVNDGEPPKAICNFKLERSEDETGEEKWVPRPLPICDISDGLATLTDGWPRRVGPALFVPQPDGNSVAWLTSTEAVMAYIGAATRTPPNFVMKSGFHTKSEFTSHLVRTAQDYVAIEVLPHEPQMPGHYYTRPSPEPGDGMALSALLDCFSPETVIDRDLMLAAFMTPFWGGRGGTRPAFCFTADSGRGSGKSFAAMFVANLAGGFIDIENNEDIQQIKTRLLSSAGLTKRVILLDNVKTNKFSWAELEALVTASTISGKQLYIGEGQRPNNLTVLMTMNGASMSADFAQRAVLIKLAKPLFSATWAEDTQAFIDEYRQQIIADIIGILKRPGVSLRHYSRWGDWERDVLSKLPEPSESQIVIRERQEAMDVDSEEADIIEEHFREKLEELDYSTTADHIFIPNTVVGKWFSEATGDQHAKAIGITRAIKQKILEGKIHRIRVCPGRANGRGLEWSGEDATANAALLTTGGNGSKLKRT